MIFICNYFAVVVAVVVVATVVVVVAVCFSCSFIVANKSSKSKNSVLSLVCWNFATKFSSCWKVEVVRSQAFMKQK